MRGESGRVRHRLERISLSLPGEPTVTAVLCIGQAVQDFVFSVDTMPAAASKYRARRFETMGGGPAATAAVAIARLGGHARLAARLGDDSIGDIVLDELTGYGVDCDLVKRLPGRTSSLSAVIVDDGGERMIVNFLDSDMESTPAWLPDSLPDDIDAVLADTRWPEGALHGLKLARDAGVPGVLDGDTPVPQDGDLLRAATHVAFSADGLAGYAGESDPRDALKSVAESTDAFCCVTLGAGGTLYLQGGEPRRIDACRVAVGDTLGAGDVWHGAFALALGEGQASFDALRFASAAAALKVQNGGGRAGAPTRHDVEALMTSYAGEQSA